MENRFKMRISRMFKSSFGSCKSKNISDVVDNNTNKKQVFYPQNSQHYKLVDLFSPNPHRLFPSLCAPKFSKKFPTQQSNIHPSGGIRKTITEAVSIYCHNSTLSEGRKCPPASPIFPHYCQDNTYYERTTKKKVKKKKKKKKTKTKTTRSKIKRFGFEEFPNFYYKGLFRSDEETDEDDDSKTNFFSSRSFTNSDSSELSFGQHEKRVTHTPRRRRRRAASSVKAADSTTSLAVVKKSSDPYSDFRESMLEMIVENQIFGAKELEKLLDCFLSLNSEHHHGVILQVFTEICEALLIL